MITISLFILRDSSLSRRFFQRVINIVRHVGRKGNTSMTCTTSSGLDKSVIPTLILNAPRYQTPTTRCGQVFLLFLPFLPSSWEPPVS